MKTFPFSLVLVAFSSSLFFAACSEKKPTPDYKSCTAKLKSDKSKSLCWEATTFTFDEYDDADDFCAQALGNMVEIDSTVTRASFSISATEGCDIPSGVKCEKLRSDVAYRLENAFYLYGGYAPNWCAPVK